MQSEANGSQDIESKIEQELGTVKLAGSAALWFTSIAFCWTLFQLWIASPLDIETGTSLINYARPIHLAFALTLCFLLYRPSRGKSENGPGKLDLALIALGLFATGYLVFNHHGIAQRAGEMLVIPFAGFNIPVEAIIGWIGLSVLLIATKRAIGWPLVTISLVFFIYSLFGPYMPSPLDHKGVSLSRLADFQWITDLGVFGKPIEVTVSVIFLFVLFGAMLNRAGAGQYFIDLAFAAVGKYRGGPAKASVLASGMTGLISGSSIANTVTTGTFTIPAMKKTGIPATKAGAIEVAASTDSQIMPPIMGAAAFVMAEFLGMSYSDVIIHAALPALMSYIGLFYVTHLEALKLDLKPLAKADIPRFKEVFWRGAHFLLPILLLIYLLLGLRLTTSTAIFWSTIALTGLILVDQFVASLRTGSGPLHGIAAGLETIFQGMVDGAKNMIPVSIAVASAGIIVGAVGSTGLSNAMIGIVEVISGGNVYILLILTAVLCLLLGMGLPTTANYLVVAAIMAPVLSQLGQAAGLEMPLIAVHLFVFYFGLMADVTPPVGLAAYAASAISRADPIKTGIQAFIYSMRTAILPFVFIFNLDLILYNVTNPFEAALIFAVGLIAIMAFTTLTFRYFIMKLNWAEMVALAFITFALMRPDFLMNRIEPPYEPVKADALHKGIKTSQLRIFVERDTDYGTQQKLAIFKPFAGSNILFPSTMGWTMRDGKVATVNFMSPAENAGLQTGDRIVRLEQFVPGQTDPKYLFIPALLLLLLLAWQHKWRAARINLAQKTSARKTAE